MSKQYTDIQMEHMVSNYIEWLNHRCTTPVSEMEWMVNLLLDSEHKDKMMECLKHHEAEIGFRTCSVTGERIEEGYCLFDGEAYYKNTDDLVDELRNFERELGLDKEFLTDEEVMDRAYDKGWYYWTGWHQELE